MLTPTTRRTADGIAAKYEADLPKLPIPKLEDTCKRYLRCLEPLQDADEHERTKAVVEDFLASGEGAKWQSRLEEYDKSVDSYIEEFWCESSARCLALSIRLVGVGVISHRPTPATTAHGQPIILVLLLA